MKSYLNIEDNKRYMVIEESATEEIDKVAAGMLENNEIIGLLPFCISRIDNTVSVTYDITSLVPVSEILEECIGKECVITIMDTIIELYSNVGNYLIDPESLILDTHKMFYDRENKKFFMTVMPFVNKNIGNPPLNVFLKNIICQIRFDSTENCDYIGKMLGYLNSGKNFTISDFKYIIDEQKFTFKPTENKKIIVTEKISEKEEIPVVSDNLPSSEYKISKSKKIKEDKEDDEDNFRLPLDIFADDDNDEEIKNKKSIFSKIFGDSKSGKRSKKKESHDSDDRIKVQYCDINGEIKEEIEYSEGTLLIGEKNNSKKSFLLRLKNNEKIILEKNSFKIGTDRRSVDYCITDNSAVSRMHAEIIHRNDSYFIIDNNSTNHTFLNEHEIRSKNEIKLQNKSRIKLADEEFIFYY